MRDHKGLNLAYDNNSGAGNDSKLTYTALNSGVYFLDVGDISNNNIGNYEVFAKSIVK